MNKKNRPFGGKGTGQWVEGLTILMRFGLIMALSILIFLYIGLYLDKKLGTRGIFTLILTLFGIIGGARTVYHQIMDLTTKDEDNNHH